MCLDNDFIISKGFSKYHKLLLYFRTHVTLTKEIGTDPNSREIPSSILIRCYDYGPKGKLTIKVKKRGLFGGTTTVSHSVPFDENDNGILDGFHSDYMRSHTWFIINKPCFDPGADDETFANNNNDGDGWSIADEYRGLWNGSSHFRLNPFEKDVMYTSDAGMSSYGTGAHGIPHHTLYFIDSNFINNPFGPVYNADKSALLPSSQIDRETGRVNFNSDDLPGFKRVWAIRIVTDTVLPADQASVNTIRQDTQGTSDALLQRLTLGQTFRGSPHRASKILMFNETSGVVLKYVFDKYVRDPRYNFSYNASQLNSATRIYISGVLTHEIGHTLNLGHINNIFDVMNAATNYTLDLNLPTGAEIILKAVNFSLIHRPDWAATGHPVSSRYKCVHPAFNDIDVINAPENPEQPPTPPTPPQPPTNTPTPPSEPLNVIVTHGDGNVALSWQEPADTGTSPITSYEYSYREADSGTWSDWESTESTDTLAYITDLTNGVLYEQDLRKLNRKRKYWTSKVVISVF